MHMWFDAQLDQKILDGIYYKVNGMWNVISTIYYYISLSPEKLKTETELGLRSKRSARCSLTGAWFLALGPFKYYVSMFSAFLGSPTHLRQHKYYCKSAKIALF